MPKPCRLVHNFLLSFLFSNSENFLDIIGLFCFFYCQFLSLNVINIVFDEILIVYFAVNHVFEDVNYFIKFRPFTTFNLGKYTIILSINFKGSKPWKENNLSCFLIHIFLAWLTLWYLEQSLGKRSCIDLAVWYLFPYFLGKLLKEINVFDLIMTRTPGM